MDNSAKQSQEQTLPLWKICMVSCVAIAINVGFSLIASYGIPLILATGLDIKYATLIFSISSILSFLLQGFLGTTSDHCTCVWGRRRPFIVTFSVLTIIGLLFSSYSFYFGIIPINHSTILVAGCVYIGIILCDFSVGVLQLPSRAYLLDVISSSQAEIANFIYSAMFGVGTIIGTLFGAMKWSLITHQPVTVPHQAQIVYALASVVITVCMLIAVCSVKERTYKINEKHPLINDVDEDFDDEIELNTQKNCFKRFIDPFLDIFIFLPKMSYHMWLLWIMTFCSFLGLVFFNSYVTLYVGTVVYGGDPHANHSTDSYQRYATGVHTGTWALFLAAITNTISSLTLNFVIKLVSLKTIFLTSTALYCVGTCLLIYFHQLPVVFTVGAIYGVYLGLTLTVPYVLIPIYKDKDMLFKKGKRIEDEAIEGRACAVINTGMFLSLLIASFITGPLLSVAGDYIYIMFFGCIGSFLTFFSTLFVKMPEAQKH